MNINKKSIIIIGSIFIFVMIIVLVFFGKQEQNNHNRLDNKDISNNLKVEDDMINFLYERYHPEDNLKFRIVGNNSKNSDYAFYYKKKKTTFDDFSDIYKSYILLDLMNYQDDYDEERECYLYSLEEFKNAYEKYYGRVDDFVIDTNEEYVPHFYLDEDSICISREEMYHNDYDKTIDTYMVNGIYQDDKIIIYERVAFIKVEEDVLEFYKDYDMKDKVYTLEKENSDLGFINNSKIVSNVLMNYQDKFPIYEYTYIKNGDHYYLESITK